MTLRRFVPWLLAFALVAAQALGFAHRVLHLPAAAGSHAAVATQDGGHGLKDLFGHDGGPDCRLYDQLTHGDGLSAAPLAFFLTLLPIAVLPWLQGEALARWAALFDARGPPTPVL